MSTRAPSGERRLVLRRTLFAVWAIAFVPLFAALHSHLHLPPLPRSLMATGVFCASAAAGLWFLGWEKHPRLRAWRIFFVLWAILLLPLLLAVAAGIAEEGWPRGRGNRTTARVVLMVVTMSIPAFLAGLAALLRTYRLAGGLALVSGLVSLVDGVLLLRITSRVRFSTLDLSSVLDILAGGSKLEGYLAMPAGVALIVGGIMTFRAARVRAISAS
jgi:hypothetical protein